MKDFRFMLEKWVFGKHDGWYMKYEYERQVRKAAKRIREENKTSWKRRR